MAIIMKQILPIERFIGFVNVVTKWSDDSTTSEDDGTGAARVGLKIGLLIAALAVICIVACFLMLYSTIMGLSEIITGERLQLS